MVSRTAAVFVLILMITSVFASYLPSAASQSNYSEDISVTLIGRSAYWSIKMRGDNVSMTGLTEIEAAANGVSGYSLSYMDSSRWSPEFELFSNAGYDLLGFDAVPSSGIFLKVSSGSLEAAERLVDSLSQLLRLRLTLYTFSGGTYTFYSHMDPGLLRDKLWSAVPAGLGGAARLIDQNAFAAQEIPIFRFSGERIGGSFAHAVEIAGLKRNAVPPQNEFKIADLLPAIGTTNSSASASSSTVSIQAIGSFVTYVEEGAVLNFPDNRSALVTAAVEPGTAFPAMTVELAQSFPSVIATRTADRAALSQGDIVTIGIRVRNAAPLTSTPVGNVTVNDDWWMTMPEFEFVDGEHTRSLGHLAPDSEFTLAYRLRLVSSAAGEVLTPPSAIVYSYPVEGGQIEEKAMTNPLRLVLNDIRPAISVEASIEPVAHPIFGAIPVNLTIRNNGNGHATNLEVESNSRQSLLSGDFWQISVDLPQRPLTDLRASSVWSVSWDEGGQRRKAVSNSITVYYNITGSTIPNFAVTRSVTPPISDGEAQIKDSVSVSNRGAVQLDRVSLRGTLPAGFSLLEGNYTRQGDILSAESIGVEANGRVTYGYAAVVSNPDENYVLPPTEITVEASGLRLNRLAPAEVLPLGVKVVKSFEPAANFLDGNVTVDARVVNRGSVPIFGVTFNVGADSFLKIAEGGSSFTQDILTQGESLGSANQATLISAGRFQTSLATTSFTVAGHVVSRSSEATTVNVYRPVSADLTISPENPMEGEEFNAVLTVRNPSAVTVRDVNVGISLPSGLRVKEGSLRLDAEELGPDATLTRSAVLVADAPIVIPIDSPTISFTYEGAFFQGTSSPLTIVIQDNTLTRYGIPTAVATLLIFATAYVVRRIASPKVD